MASKTFTKSTQQSAPSFSKLLEDTSCLSGQDATLECCVQGYPIPDIRWEKGGIQLAHTRRIHTERQGDKCRLHIKSCSRLETGVFKCIASNKFGTASTTATVRSDGIPASATSKMNSSLTKGPKTEEDKIPEFKKNLPMLKKVSKPTEEKSNGVKSTPSFKEFQLKKTPLRNSFKRTTEPPQLERVAPLKKTTLNGHSSPPKAENQGKVNPVSASVETQGKEKSVKQDSPLSRVPSIRKPNSNGISHTAKNEDHISKPIVKKETNTSYLEAKAVLKKVEKQEATTTTLKTSTLEWKVKQPISVESTKTNGVAKASKKENEPQRVGFKTTTPKSGSQATKEDKSGPTSRKSSLRQRKQPPTFVLPLKSKVVKEGESVRFMCSSSGVPEPRVTWKKKDMLLSPSERVLCYQADCMHILEIKEVTEEDAGDFTVTLENEVGRADAAALLEVKAKKPTSVAPKVIRPLADQSVTDGQPCILSCEVSGTPTPKCQWSRDGKPLEPHPDFKEDFDGLTATLSIREVFPDDEGTYSLTAKNSVGEVTTSCNISVKKTETSIPDEEGKVPVFTRKLNDLEVNDGDPLTLAVEVSGSEPMEIVWVHNESMIKNSPDFRYISTEDRKCHSLVIEEVFPEDAGVYFCEAYNLFGEDVTACMVNVKVLTNAPDESSSNNKNITQTAVREPAIKSSEPVEKLISSAKKQSEGQLKDAKNAFRKSIVKAKGATSTDDRHRSELKQTAHDSKSDRTMDLDHAGPPSDTTEYQNGVMSSRRSSHVSPRLSPAQILKGPRSIAVLRGETITLRCQFVGSPAPTVSWVKGGKVLTPGDRISLDLEEAQAVLTIKGAMTDDSGKYVIVVENSGGSDCQFASVSVEGPPDPLAERPVVTDATNHSLVLAWSGSPFDGGSVITGYAVEMCSLPELRWQRVSVARHSTSYVVKNLLPNRSYMFRIRAENVHGFSDPSPESETVFIRDADEEPEEPVFEEKSVTIQNGSLFSEKYDFLEIVGKGRFGVVHRCQEKVSGEVRAAKVIRCVKQKDKQRMREEVDIMNLLRHPKLLQLVAAFENPKDLILVMEYISGGELFERVIADDFVLLEKDCVLFLHQICEGVRYMHDNNIIHLDLKPENILCVTKTSHHIKIIDFGLAKKLEPNESIRVLFGTPEFVAPEVISYEPVSSASDMWSIGVICYVLLTGLSPFMGDSDAETFANITRVEYDFDDEAFETVSADAKDFIDRLFKKRPEKRMSAQECLKHIWLAKDQNRMSVVQISTDKLKRFIIRRKWQKTGNAIRALGRMVSLSSPSRSISSFSSQTDSEVSFQTQSSLSCNPAITEKDEDNESGVFLSSEGPGLAEVQG